MTQLLLRLAYRSVGPVPSSALQPRTDSRREGIGRFEAEETVPDDESPSDDVGGRQGSGAPEMASPRAATPVTVTMPGHSVKEALRPTLDLAPAELGRSSRDPGPSRAAPDSPGRTVPTSEPERQLISDGRTASAGRAEPYPAGTINPRAHTVPAPLTKPLPGSDGNLAGPAPGLAPRHRAAQAVSLDGESPWKAAPTKPGAVERASAQVPLLQPAPKPPPSLGMPRSAETETRPVIQVRIGTIEVRAARPARQSLPSTPTQPQPVRLGFEDFDALRNYRFWRNM